MKKMVKYGIGGAVAAGIITGITVPLVMTINKKDDLPDYRKIDMDQEAWDGKTLQQLVDGVKEEEQIKGSLVTELSKVSAFYLYDKEQLGSIDLQKMDLEFQKKKLQDEKAKPATTAARQTAIDTEITKIDEKITKLASLTKADYEEQTFKTKFPLILMKREVITERQKSILLDTKNAFVARFSTTTEGENAWLDEMKKKYNGATSTDQAVSMLVYSIIRKDAFAATRYKFNSQYTVEQMDSGKYSFLTHATKKATNPRETDKVYFVSTESKIPSKIFVDHTNVTSGSIIDKLSRTHLVETHHALIKAIQNEKGGLLPWNIKKEDLIGDGTGKSYGLLSYYGQTGSKRFYELIGDMVSGTTFDEDVFKKFVKHATGQPSAAKEGSLGLNYELESTKGMVPGFALGSIEAMSDRANTDGIAIINTLKGKIDTWMTSKTITSQEKLEQVINSMSAEEITQEFGSMFSSTFGEKPKLFYGLKNNAYLVISKFGIHIIWQQKYTTPAELEAQITKDLKKAADDQSISGSVIDYTKLFAKSQAEEQVLRDLLADTNFKVEDGYNKTEATKTNEDFPTQYEELPANAPAGTQRQKMTWADVKAQIIQSLDNIEKTKSFKLLGDVIGTSLDTWLKTQYDSNLRDSTTSAEDIYRHARTLGGLS